MGIKENQEFLRKLAESLSPVERKVVRVLDNFSSFHDIIKVTELKDVEVMRAFQWLQNKNIIKIKEDEKEIVSLDENGLKYLKYGLPEKIFLEALDKPSSLAELKEKTGLSDEELAISLGTLKSKAAIEITKEKGIVVSITENGRQLSKRGFAEEQFLKERFPRQIDSLNAEERFVLDNLRKRKKIVKVGLSKIIDAELTQIGKKLAKERLEE